MQISGGRRRVAELEEEFGDRLGKFPSMEF
jgi:hypothetical protein